MRILLAAILGLGLAACAGKEKKDSEKGPVTPPAAAATAAAAEGKGNENKTPATPQEAAIAALATKEAKAVAVKTVRGPVPADKALGWLKNGNTRFIKHRLRSDGDSAKDRARLTVSQKPHTIVLSCSDSRTPPEVLFDQKLGEIYVVRTAGQSLDFSAIASIEHALKNFGSNLILVMGHESCEAVKTALATMNGSDAGSPSLNSMVRDLHPHLKSFAGKPLSEAGAVEAWANTSGVAKDLVARSQIVRDALNSGEVKIQTALYHLGSGVVDFR